MGYQVRGCDTLGEKVSTKKVFVEIPA
jgi:hypothetical protein